MTIAPSDSRVRPTAVARAGSLVALGVVAVVGAMHLLAPWSRHDPVRRTISEYAVGPGGWVFDAAVLGLVGATVAVVTALVLGGIVPDRSAAVVLLGVWCVGLVLVVVFEKTNWSVGPSLSGSIHRYASLAAFLALPAAGLLVARRHRGERWGPVGHGIRPRRARLVRPDHRRDRAEPGPGHALVPRGAAGADRAGAVPGRGRGGDRARVPGGTTIPVTGGRSGTPVDVPGPGAWRDDVVGFLARRRRVVRCPCRTSSSSSTRSARSAG